jgi:hypothetical protein
VRKRQWKTYHDSTDDTSAQHIHQDANLDSRSTSLEGPSPIIQYDGITIRDISNTSAHSDVAQFAALPSVDVSVDIVADNKFIQNIKILFLGVLLVCSFYTNQTVSSFHITYSLCGIIRLLNSVGFIQGMIQSLLACLQTGGVRKFKTFPKTLTMIWGQIVEKTEQDSIRVAMPASTKITTACETKTKSKGFVTRLSLFDTGTDAYLRQDNSLFSSYLPSTMVFNIAGPETLSASQTGLLNLLVKDDKRNMHQLKLENALVVPGLSQNLRRTNNSLKTDIWFSFIKSNM